MKCAVTNDELTYLTKIIYYKNSSKKVRAYNTICLTHYPWGS